jgi:hypothetical protein
MTRFIHAAEGTRIAQFAKDYLEEILSPDREVAGEKREID